jgi:hypothetical protein
LRLRAAAFFEADQDVQGAVGKGQHRDAQVFAQQMSGAPSADDDLDPVANHVPRQGNGVVQSLGIDKDLILLAGRQDLDPFDQGVAGSENTDPDFFMGHGGLSMGECEKCETISFIIKTYCQSTLTGPAPPRCN